MILLKSKYLFNTIKLFTIFFITLFITKNTIAGTNWDGRYNATFQFKMGPGSVCPSKLPIEMEIIITNSKAEGFIFNNGGGNKHEFCKLYHNGTITGNVGKNGEVKFSVKQNDSHAKKYSSYKIKGDIEGKLELISRSYQYHPPHKFQLTRAAD